MPITTVRRSGLAQSMFRRILRSSSTGQPEAVDRVSVTAACSAKKKEHAISMPREIVCTKAWLRLVGRRHRCSTSLCYDLPGVFI